MKSLNQKQLNSIGDNLYKKFGQPLEGEHWGEYIAISKKGKVVLSSDLKDVFNRSLKILGPGSFIFKIGEKAVYKWRRIKF